MVPAKKATSAKSSFADRVVPKNDTASDKAETTEPTVKQTETSEKPFPTDSPTPTSVDSPTLSTTLENQLATLPPDDGFDQSHSNTNTPPDGTSGKVSVVQDEQGQITTVPTWRENPDHNLGKVHPDVTPLPDPAHQSTTSKQVYVTQYAGVAENDDKGIVGPEDLETNDEENTPVSEYAPENENDDKNIR